MILPGFSPSPAIKSAETIPAFVGQDCSEQFTDVRASGCHQSWLLMEFRTTRLPTTNSSRSTGDAARKACNSSLVHSKRTSTTVVKKDISAPWTLVAPGGNGACVSESTSAATFSDDKELGLRLAVAGAGVEEPRLSQAESSASGKSAIGSNLRAMRLNMVIRGNSPTNKPGAVNIMARSREQRHFDANRSQ